MSDVVGTRKFQIINPPNLLKSKVGGGGFALGVLEKAAKVLESLRGEFEELAKSEVEKLVAAANVLVANPSDLASRDEVYKIAHELRGQGGSYGYPLVTEFGDKLCRYLDAAAVLDAKSLVVVKATANAIAVVINSKISGDGGDTGRALVAMLAQVLAQVKGE